MFYATEVSGGFRIYFLDEHGCEAGHVYVYFLTNDLHKRPFAFVEDLFVEEFARGLNLGYRLMACLEELANVYDCYKIVGCFRNEKAHLHKFYEKLDYDTNWGVEFRKNLE
jgi:GNAT superfamily N-acetyltransferase